MLSTANRNKLRNLVNASTLDVNARTVLITLINTLAAMPPAAADGTAGATGTIGSGATVKDGLVVSLGS